MINLKKADPVDLNKSVVQPMLANMMPCPDEQVVDDGWLYQQLAKDFGRWLKDARTAGIVA